jgi:hypothetical protein
MKAVGPAYVRNCYDRYVRKFFPDDSLPEFSYLDFEFAEYPDELGSVDWDEHGLPSLSLSPMLRKYPSLLRSVLIHEICHLKLGTHRHGKAFYDEAMRVAALGGIRVWC